MENGKESAFACSDNGTEYTTTWQGQKGLTKREYFAGLAMQGFIAKFNAPTKKMAEWSVEAADELLKQLDETNKH